ncbi:MAG: PilZ domain-containing protein [Pseudomonadota bacterium]
MLVTLPKRRPKRIRVLIDGKLVSPLGEAVVRVRDISKEGALVETSDETSDVGEVELTFLEKSHAGTIAWREGSWLGITFNKELTKKVWKELSAKQLRVGAPRNYRHDEIEEDPERIEVTPRDIRMRLPY